MQNQALRHGNAQSGNALWYILIAIALLAALSFALTRNSSKMSSNLSDDQLAMTAGQIQREFNTMGQAVQKLLTVNNCSMSELNFDNPVTTGYVNPSAPADKRCNIYSPEGAGLTVKEMPKGVSTYTGGPAYWIISAGSSVNGVGPEYAEQTICSSGCGDLVIGEKNITLEMCNAYNALVKVGTGTPPSDPDDSTQAKFTGTFAEGNTGATRVNVGNGSSTTALYGVKTACYSPYPNGYEIYYVLIAR